MVYVIFLSFTIKENRKLHSWCVKRISKNIITPRETQYMASKYPKSLQKCQSWAKDVSGTKFTTETKLQQLFIPNIPINVSPAKSCTGLQKQALVCYVECQYCTSFCQSAASLLTGLWQTYRILSSANFVSIKIHLSGFKFCEDSISGHLNIVWSSEN